ncbi:MAG: enoyl-CoA hydratase, partial [Methylobacterium sp.]
MPAQTLLLTTAEAGVTTLTLNNPAARRALFKALNQADFMEAASAGDQSMYTVPAAA